VLRHRSSSTLPGEKMRRADDREYHTSAKLRGRNLLEQNDEQQAVSVPLAAGGGETLA
jgi:hypothetical protein